MAKAVSVADGFLGRWSQRKQALREGRVVEDLPPAPKAPVAETDLPAAAVQQSVAAVAGEAGRGHRAGLAPDAATRQPGTGAVVPQKPAPTPTLEDVKALNADSSFAPFVSRDVAPDVRNAAMKKLFTDPHYNVMDGLDIYIDDYAKPDPMPAAMMRQMASAKFLNLFDDDTTSTPTQAPAPTSTSATPIENTPHDHTDLRLQPDDAARPEGLEREPERTPDAAFQPVPQGSR